MSHPSSNPPDAGRAYNVQIGNQDLEFHAVELHDPVPTGRQLIDAGNFHPAEDHVAIALLPNGATETLRLDETFDLRGQGIERVVIFKTDRTFRFEVDRQEREWGTALISGRVIKILANVDPGAYDLYQEVRGNDPLIRDEQVVDLSVNGVEHYYTIITETTEGLAALPPADTAYLAARGIDFTVVCEGEQTAVILTNYPTPTGKFDHASVDVLILLPSGYPDALVDMFYCFPWIKLTSKGDYPNAANVELPFSGRVWQRWSRHNYSWRAGIDGIHTVLARLDRALNEAV